MFFVVGTGRSGTQSMARALSSLPNCTCLHEPSPELILESSSYRYGTLDGADLAKILRDTRYAKVNGSVYCESNQTISLIIPIVVEVFPEARFVWLIRNGLDVVASAYQKQWYTGHSENHDRYEDCPPLEKAWIDGRVRGDRCGEMTAADWGTLDRFSKCCWYWSYVNRVVGEDLTKYAPNRWYSLRLEEIDEQMANLIRWMGLHCDAPPRAERHNVAKRVPYHWTQWSPGDHETFEFWCGELMDRFYPSWRVYVGEDSHIFVAPAIGGLTHQVQTLRQQLQPAAERLERQAARLNRLAAEKADLQTQLDGLRSSRSWRMTEPLRRVARALRRVRGK